MKKALILLSAIALVGIASCQKQENNPNYNAETDEVMTRFVLSVSNGQAPQTKMSAGNVQVSETANTDPHFLGMQDAVIFAYASNLESAANVADPAPVYVTNESTFKKKFDLGKLYAAGTVNATQTNRILQLTVPTGVNSVLIYGKATNDVPAATPTVQYKDNALDKNFAQRGSTAINVSSTMANTTFDVVKRLGTEDDVKAYDATGRLMIKVINTLIATGVELLAAGSTYETYENLPALTWTNLGHRYMQVNNLLGSETFDAAAAGLDRDLLPLEEVIGRTWYIMTYIKDGEYRAGSSNAIRSMMQNMHDMITKAAGSTPTSPEEANAKRLAERIRTKMAGVFDSTNDWKYRSTTEIQTALNISQTEWDDTTDGYAKAKDLNNYPYEDFGVPEGAAQLAFDHTNETFSYLRPNQPLVNPNANEFDPRKYLYPAELMYYVNSGIRVTADEVTDADFPDGVSNWDTGNQGTSNLWTAKDWKVNRSVNSNTHGIAVRDNINYGVAVLKTSVAYTAAAQTGGLLDNRENATPIAVSNAKITLSGILVGGVNPRFDWQYLPIHRDGEYVTGQAYGDFDGVIYDDQIVDANIPSVKPTYTLVYDNYNRDKSKDEQNPVYITLEFVNGGDAFWGRDNVIPKGGKFYLVAKLLPTAKDASDDYSYGHKNSISWDNYYQVPPTFGVTKTTAGTTTAPSNDKKVGQSMEIPRVFIQNYMTTANFFLGTESLKYAYYSVPDLKSAQVSVGLSVDISWKQGYEYDIQFGSVN